jgi:hypothetical protein
MLLEPLDGQDEVLGPIQRTYTTRIDVFHRRLLPLSQPWFAPSDSTNPSFDHRCLIPVFLVCNCAFFFSSLMIIGLWLVYRWFSLDLLIIAHYFNERAAIMRALGIAVFELKRQLDSLQSPSQLATSRSPRGPLFWPFVLWFTQRHPSWTDNDRRFL